MLCSLLCISTPPDNFVLMLSPFLQQRAEESMAVDKNEGFYLQSHSLTVMYSDDYGAQLRVSKWNKNLFLKKKERNSNKSNKK